MMSLPRYAIYFAPADGSQLAQFGEMALRRRPDGSDSNHLTCFRNDSQAHKSLARFPRHYGFHATIKAPFELADGMTKAELDQALHSYCLKQTPVELSLLKPQQVQDRFLALTCQPSKAVDTLAFDTVKYFEKFRAALNQSDIARRKPESLTPKQRDYLFQYGYPYVGDHFHFHMTLSDQADTAFLDFLVQQYERLVSTPQWLSHLALFRQPDRQSAFVRIGQYQLG